MSTKPEVLMIGPYPAWDMEDIDARYVVHKLWEAADRDRLIEAHCRTIRAIATRGELGASADLISVCQRSRSSPAMASVPTPSTWLMLERMESG